MENFNVKINLSKFVRVCTLTSKKNGKKYVCLPIEDNYIFEGKKGYYLDLTAFANKESKYGDTHYLKNQVPQEIYKEMTKEEKNSLEIVGSMSVFSFKNEVTENVNSQNFTGFDEESPFD